MDNISGSTSLLGKLLKSTTCFCGFDCLEPDDFFLPEPLPPSDTVDTVLLFGFDDDITSKSGSRNISVPLRLMDWSGWFFLFFFSSSFLLSRVQICVIQNQGKKMCKFSLPE